MAILASFAREEVARPSREGEQRPSPRTAPGGARELAPIMYLDDSRWRPRSVKDTGRNKEYFWRDFVLWMFRWSAAALELRVLVRSELERLRR